MNNELEKLPNKDKLVATYNKKSVHQDIPFKTASSFKSREVDERVYDWRTTEERRETLPVMVGTGCTGVIEKDREVLTDGMFGCAALLIQGENANSLTHMVSGNDPRQFGYWEEHGFNPLEKTGQKISDVLKLLGDTTTESCRAIILAGGKVKDRKKHLQNLKDKLVELGINKVRIVETPTSNAVVYFSPDTRDSVRIIGTENTDDGQQIVKHYDVDIEGEDSTLDTLS